MSFHPLQNQQVLPQEISYEVVRPVLNWVYIWMFFGLIITGAVAWVTASSETLLPLITRNSLIIILLVQLGITVAMSAMIERLSQGMMTLLYFAYAALTGFTFSILFLVFDLSSIVMAFVVTAGVFGAMSIVGFTTKMDLTRLGGFLLMALIGLLIAMVVNLFVQSSMLDLVIEMAGVLIFTGLVAYKTQWIKGLAWVAANRPDDQAFQAKISVYGAFSLYLTFINLFLFILRLTGRRR